MIERRPKMIELLTHSRPIPDELQFRHCDLPWRAGLSDVREISRFEGGIRYSAVGADAYWIVTTQDLFAGFEDCYLTTVLERFSSRQRWETAVAGFFSESRCPR